MDWSVIGAFTLGASLPASESGRYNAREFEQLLSIH